jgi:tRNA U34 2-thiouridine synthase MnmA/TrmU
VAEEPSGDVEAKIRSASTLRPAVYSDGLLSFPDGVTAAARGQSAVLYRDEEVLGGGIIAEAR